MFFLDAGAEPICSGRNNLRSISMWREERFFVRELIYFLVCYRLGFSSIPSLSKAARLGMEVFCLSALLMKMLSSIITRRSRPLLRCRSVLDAFSADNFSSMDKSMLLEKTSSYLLGLGLKFLSFFPATKLVLERVLLVFY